MAGHRVGEGRGASGGEGMRCDARVGEGRGE